MSIFPFSVFSLGSISKYLLDVGYWICNIVEALNHHLSLQRRVTLSRPRQPRTRSPQSNMSQVDLRHLCGLCKTLFTAVSLSLLGCSSSDLPRLPISSHFQSRAINTAEWQHLLTGIIMAPLPTQCYTLNTNSYLKLQAQTLLPSLLSAYTFVDKKTASTALLLSLRALRLFSGNS